MTPEHFALYEQAEDALCEDACALQQIDPELSNDFAWAALTVMRARIRGMKREAEDDDT